VKGFFALDGECALGFSCHRGDTPRQELGMKIGGVSAQTRHRSLFYKFRSSRQLWWVNESSPLPSKHDAVLLGSGCGNPGTLIDGSEVAQP